MTKCFYETELQGIYLYFYVLDFLVRTLQCAETVILPMKVWKTALKIAELVLPKEPKLPADKKIQDSFEVFFIVLEIYNFGVALNV